MSKCQIQIGRENRVKLHKNQVTVIFFQLCSVKMSIIIPVSFVLIGSVLIPFFWKPIKKV